MFIFVRFKDGFGLDFMPKRDVVCWTTMVGGSSGFCEEAVRVFFSSLVRYSATQEQSILNRRVPSYAFVKSPPLREYPYMHTHEELASCQVSSAYVAISLIQERFLRGQNCIIFLICFKTGSF